MESYKLEFRQRETVVWKAANCKNRLSIFSNSFRFCQCQPIYELSPPVFPVFHRETVLLVALDCPFIGKLSSLQDYFLPQQEMAISLLCIGVNFRKTFLSFSFLAHEKRALFTFEKQLSHSSVCIVRLKNTQRKK